MTVRSLLAAAALAILAMSIAACGGEPDGELIDGIRVGAATDCAGWTQPSCDDLIRCAIVQAWPSDPPSYRSVTVFDRPTRARDGTLLLYGIGGAIVVFEFEDGTRTARFVVETDDC
jgi:hypothetical protein